MDKKQIARIVFDEDRKLELKVTEEALEICNVSFSSSHDQVCCENVYAEFSCVEGYITQLKSLYGVRALEIVGVEDMGFLFIAENESGKRVPMLINCYNSQNGYYSDNLDLVVTKDGVESKYNLSGSDFIQHNID